MATLGLEPRYHDCQASLPADSHDEVPANERLPGGSPSVHSRPTGGIFGRFWATLGHAARWRGLPHSRRTRLGQHISEGGLRSQSSPTEWSEASCGAVDLTPPDVGSYSQRVELKRPILNGTAPTVLRRVEDVDRSVRRTEDRS
jgi:hypothetical protein